MKGGATVASDFFKRLPVAGNSGRGILVYGGDDSTQERCRRPILAAVAVGAVSRRIRGGRG